MSKQKNKNKKDSVGIDQTFVTACVLFGVIILYCLISFHIEKAQAIRESKELRKQHQAITLNLEKEKRRLETQIQEQQRTIKSYQGLTDQNIELCSLRKHKLYCQIEKIILKHNLCKHELTNELFFTKLLFFTAIVESQGGKYLDQLSGGPGLGYYQIEPSTHNDIYLHYLRFNPKLEKLLISAYDNTLSERTNLKHNFEYQTLVAWVHYKRNVKKNVDLSNLSLDNISKVWKDEFNTKRGRGDSLTAIKRYKQSIERCKTNVK